MSEKKSDEKIEIPHGEILEIPIYYTNDLHGEMENFSRAATVLRKKKKDGEKFLLFDAGDFASGTDISNKHRGKPMVELINITGYDAIGLGEGELMFDRAGLEEILESLKCPVVCANLYFQGETLFPGIKRFITKKFEDVTFGITGFLTTKAVHLVQEKTQNALPGLNELSICPPEKILREVLEDARNEGAQRFILLSHLGIEKDAELAEKIPGLDVIISGHSHSQLPQPVKVKDTLIVSSGAGGKYIGSLTLSIADVISMKISK